MVRMCCPGHKSISWNAEQMEKFCRLIVGWNIDGTAAEIWLSAVHTANNYNTGAVSSHTVISSF